jgi:hypothetical protein
MDLAENIGSVRGYNHLLIVMCNFSDFLLIFPLKSKTNAEISKVLRDGVFQIFNIKRIRSDNGPGFRSKPWLESMAALGGRGNKYLLPKPLCKWRYRKSRANSKNSI